MFDVPISSTGAIKEILGHYGEITLSYIKTQADFINAANYRREQEYDQRYTFLMSSLTT